jgi:hypothetical protein
MRPGRSPSIRAGASAAAADFAPAAAAAGVAAAAAAADGAASEGRRYRVAADVVERAQPWVGCAVSAQVNCCERRLRHRDDRGLELQGNACAGTDVGARGFDTCVRHGRKHGVGIVACSA